MSSSKPQRFTTIEQASDFLLRYSPEKQAGETYTLGRMKSLMTRLGNPQNDIAAVHIAGTSGKTSTAYYIRALLEAHGARTGLTSSPHITSITERVQIDGRPLADDVFMRYLEKFIDEIEAFDDLQPTYFELLTAFAFWVFRNENVDYIVIEVGLGGLLDATNVINRVDKVSAITPIGLDHTEVLGSTLTAIASQKAGIITPGSTVFTGVQDSEVLRVLRRHAQLHIVKPVRDATSTVPLFQQDNFVLARNVAMYIVRRDGLPSLSSERIAAEMLATPSGRFEQHRVGNKVVILDGAHNPQKLAAFLESLHLRHSGSFAWLVGFISAPDEKIDDCVDLLANNTDEFIATQYAVGQDIKGRRSVNADALAVKFRQRGAGVTVEDNARKALGLLLESKQRTVVVTGSLYLVALLRNQVRELAT